MKRGRHENDGVDSDLSGWCELGGTMALQLVDPYRRPKVLKKPDGNLCGSPWMVASFKRGSINWRSETVRSRISRDTGDVSFSKRHSRATT